jgi:hypothetical protein
MRNRRWIVGPANSARITKLKLERLGLFTQPVADGGSPCLDVIISIKGIQADLSKLWTRQKIIEDAGDHDSDG